MKHLDERDIDRIRVRAYFHSIEPCRATECDELCNWLDAEREEQEVLLCILRRFPTLFGVFRRASEPDLSICYVGVLLRAIRDVEDDFGLSDVETRLTTLTQRWPISQLENIERLFADNNGKVGSEADWFSVLTELYGISHLDGLGRIHSLGFPPRSPQNRNPAFDCEISCPGLPILCDIKPASGSGFALVRDELRVVIADWAMQHGLGSVDFFTQSQGTISQPSLGPQIRHSGGVAAFEFALSGHTTVPGSPLPLALGTTSFDVTLVPAATVVSSSGVQSVSARIQSLVPMLLKQIRNKADAAQRSQRQFILCHVRLPSSGNSDLRDSQQFHDWFAGATSQISPTEPAHTLWLGALVLDFTMGSPNSMCHLRRSATWPAGVTPASLAGMLSSGNLRHI